MKGRRIQRDYFGHSCILSEYRASAVYHISSNEAKNPMAMMMVIKKIKKAHIMVVVRL